MTLVLQWAEPWGRAASDFAIDVYASGGATPIRTIDTSNVVTGLPVEAQALKFAGPGTIEVAIRRVSGTGNPFLKLVAFTNGGHRGHRAPRRTAALSTQAPPLRAAR